MFTYVLTLYFFVVVVVLIYIACQYPAVSVFKSHCVCIRVVVFIIPAACHFISLWRNLTFIRNCSGSVMSFCFPSLIVDDSSSSFHSPYYGLLVLFLHWLCPPNKNLFWNVSFFVNNHFHVFPFFLIWDLWSLNGFCLRRLCRHHYR